MDDHTSELLRSSKELHERSRALCEQSERLKQRARETREGSLCPAASGSELVEQLWIAAAPFLKRGTVAGDAADIPLEPLAVALLHRTNDARRASA